MPLRDVEELCRGVVPGGGVVAIEVLGAGLLSDTYRVARDGAAYTLKIAADHGLQLGADLKWEVRLLGRAAAAGVAPPVVYSDAGRNVLLMRWVAGRPWSNEDAKDPASAGRVAQLLRRVHALEVPAPPRRICAARWIDIYAAALARRDLDAGDAALSAAAAARIRQLDAVTAASRAPDVVCHSDLHALNVIQRGDVLILLDWEYAHVGDPLWDLAGWSANNDLAAERQWLLLTEYSGRSPASADWQRLRLNLWLYDYVCLLWSQLYLSRRATAGNEVAERARLLDARLRVPANYAA
jgi:aminoglycoside phosphotransferase (APT) family kinase protein